MIGVDSSLREDKKAKQTGIKQSLVACYMNTEKKGQIQFHAKPISARSDIIILFSANVSSNRVNVTPRLASSSVPFEEKQNPEEQI